MTVDTSYLTSQVNNIVSQLHEIFDEIGIPNHERDAREAELFSALSETLNAHLKLVHNEKNELLEEAQKLITTIKQMEASLGAEKANGQYQLDHTKLRVTYPLNRCLVFLKEQHATVARLHSERVEQVKKLVEALESYSSHLDPTFVSIDLPPTSPGSSVPPSFDISPAYVTALDNEFTRVYEEYNRRINYVQATCEEIIKLWAELGTPQAQTDTSIVKFYREAPEQLGLLESDLASIKAKRDKLTDEKKARERKLKELRTAVELLWERFGVEASDRKTFLSANRGCGLRTINEFEDELARLNELKRQNLHLFVEDARCRLQELWDSLYFSEEEMLDFTPAFSDVYSDALLEAHEAEIARLGVLKEQRASTLELIEKHRGLLADRDALATSSQDASRLMARGNKGERRDPGKLLREEKMRKRITRELPKVEAELRKELERWEDEYGRPFLVHGESYLDELTPVAVKPPPRSKTPSGMVSTSKANSAKQPPPSRPASVMREPTSRPGTKTPTGSIRRNPVSSVNGAKSPSKIPARIPLGNMPQGSNNPGRGQPPNSTSSYLNNLSCKMPPPRAPPPRMRALTVEAKDDRSNSYRIEQPRPASALSNSLMRPVSPEDVFDDGSQLSNKSSSIFSHRSAAFSQSSQSMMSTRSAQSSIQGLPPPNPYLQYAPPPPAPRQVSNSSSVPTVTSGSENWETYSDATDYETEGNDVFCTHPSLAAAKRIAPDDCQNISLAGKKPKGIRSITPDNVQNAFATTDASDAEWQDEAY